MLKKLLNKETIIQMLKFGMVGLINTAISFVAFIILSDLLKINDKLSNAASYILGLINSFIFNKLLTFNSKKFSFKEMFLFIFFFLTSYFLQLGAYTLSKEYFKIDKNISFVIGMLFYTGTNFLLNKLFTFRKKLDNA